MKAAGFDNIVAFEAVWPVTELLFRCNAVDTDCNTKSPNGATGFTK